MSEPIASSEFDSLVEAQLSKLFGSDELEILVRSPEITPDGLLDLKRIDPAVLIRHLPTGKEAMCDKFHTQIRNKVACLLNLLLDTPRK